jgi:hypothetical protein
MPARDYVVLGDDGKPVLLNEEEQYYAQALQQEVNDRWYYKLKNSLGYEIPITTLTAISKKISDQKFFEVRPSEYIPVRVGEGMWSAQLTTYRSYDIGDAFETGMINMGMGNGRLAQADAGIDALNIQVNNWAKEIGWTIFELEQAARSGNWDIVAQKEKARKRNWDLGVQRIAFLGANSNNQVGGPILGLLNQGPTITTNTSVITKAISSMTSAELKTFQATILKTYRANCSFTAWPTHFVIPETDYDGLAAQASADFPVKSVLALLEEAFKLTTRNPNFKILPLAYADAGNHASVEGIAGKQVYTLLNYDDESIRMDIPLDYTNTLANSINNFAFNNVGYGQFTGVLAYRPAEMMYFTYAA